MLRYLAVLWDPADGSHTSAVQGVTRNLHLVEDGMRLALRTNGLLVYSNGSGAGAAASEPGATGVVLGTLFKRGRAGREALVRTPLKVTVDSEICEQGGGALLRSYWGRYVAIVRSERAGLTWVLRDPSGGVPCFFVVHPGVQVFFSHLDDALALGLAELRVNWEYIAAYVVNPSIQQAQTGLRDISEVLQGECIEVRGAAHTRKLYWNPLKLSAEESIEDPERAAREIRETLSSCVATWASAYQHILHRVSGGLDSSIVLACLSNVAPRPRFTCVTRYDHSIWGDEREFARLAAQHARSELIERLQDVSRMDFDRLLAIIRSPSPTWYVLNLAHHLLYDEVVEQVRADLLFSGSGGDSIFFREPGDVLPVADYLYRHPFGTRFARVAYDTALAHQRALWNVVPAALLHGLLRQPFDVSRDVESDLEFVDAGVVAEVKRSGLLRPPWLAEQDRGPPGKLCHIHRMYMADWPHHPYASRDYPDEISPLLSQPIVELFLRIPTYLLIAGGRDRMLARRAFAQDLPPRLIARSSKGGQNSYSLQVLRHHERRIRELVLEGRLSREGLLNRRKMETVLSSAYDSNTSGLMEILHTHLSAEIWLRRMAV